MTAPGRPPSHLWSGWETAVYQAAVDAIDLVVMFAGRDERRRAEIVRRSLDPTDHEGIEAIRREFADRARVLRQRR